jgi:hypothetical protein
MRLYTRGVLPLLALGVAVGLGGCANLEGQRKDLSNKASCCTSYATLPVTELPLTGLTFEIGDADPVFDFPEGKSRFRAFRLPPKVTEDTVLTVRALTPLTAVVADRKTWSPYFHPAVTFLDGDGTVLSTVNEDRPNEWCGSAATCEGVVLEPHVPAGARVAVIHTPLNKVGRFRFDEQNVPGREYLLGGAFVPVAGGAGYRRSVAVATGKLQVLLRE